MLLFENDITVAVLASGSRGNSTYIGDGRHGVLVDCGVSTAQILKRMDAIGLSGAPIDAVLVTHEHSDHVGAARVLDKKLFARTGRRVPFHMTRGTAECLNRRVVPTTIETVQPGREFVVGNLTVQPVAVPHDTLEPVCYSIGAGPLRVAVITDLGRSTRLVQRQLSTVDIAVLEFNHDVEMLMDGTYPWRLKQRIRGSHGHLSNRQAAQLVATGATARLKHLLLAHLSEENNTPERAHECASAALHQAGLSRVNVTVAQQDVPTGPVRATASVAAPTAARPRQAPATRRTARQTTTRPAPVTAPAQMALFG